MKLNIRLRTDTRSLKQKTIIIEAIFAYVCEHVLIVQHSKRIDASEVAAASSEK